MVLPVVPPAPLAPAFRRPRIPRGVPALLSSRGGALRLPLHVPAEGADVDYEEAPVPGSEPIEPAPRRPTALSSALDAPLLELMGTGVQGLYARLRAAAPALARLLQAGGWGFPASRRGRQALRIALALAAAVAFWKILSSAVTLTTWGAAALAVVLVLRA